MWEKDKWLKAAYVTGNTKEAYESCPAKSMPYRRKWEGMPCKVSGLKIL